MQILCLSARDMPGRRRKEREGSIKELRVCTNPESGKRRHIAKRIPAGRAERSEETK